jgi:fructokinase
MKALAFGEILWDIINGEEHLGGAPFNFAAHTAQCGDKAFIITRVGDDFRGIKAFNLCRKYGVDYSLVQWDEDHPTGIVDVSLDAGQPDYDIITNVAYDFIECNEGLQNLNKYQFDVFYFGSLIRRNPVSAATLDYMLQNFSFHHVFYDVNLRKGGYSANIIDRSLHHCTIFKLNVDEVPVISRILFTENAGLEKFCQMIQSAYPAITTIVITASDKGCYIYHERSLHHLPGTKVEVNDAVGAGDAFSAAFMHMLTNGSTAIDAALVANQLGAFVTTQRGAIPEYSFEMKKLLDIKPGYVTKINL